MVKFVEKFLYNRLPFCISFAPSNPTLGRILKASAFIQERHGLLLSEKESANAHQRNVFLIVSYILVWPSFRLGNCLSSVRNFRTVPAVLTAIYLLRRWVFCLEVQINTMCYLLQTHVSVSLFEVTWLEGREIVFQYPWFYNVFNISS